MGAEEAGLKTGDIIKKVDDVVINSFSVLTGYLSTKRPGEKVKLNFTVLIMIKYQIRQWVGFLILSIGGMPSLEGFLQGS